MDDNNRLPCLLHRDVWNWRGRTGLRIRGQDYGESAGLKMDHDDNRGCWIVVVGGQCETPDIMMDGGTRGFMGDILSGCQEDGIDNL